MGKKVRAGKWKYCPACGGDLDGIVCENCNMEWIDSIPKDPINREVTVTEQRLCCPLCEDAIQVREENTHDGPLHSFKCPRCGWKSWKEGNWKM